MSEEKNAPKDPEIIDAEIIDEEPRPQAPNANAGSYGRRTVAQKNAPELIAEVIETGGTMAAKTARALGNEKVADVAEGFAEVARHAPAAVAAAKEAAKPTLSALRKLRDSAVRAGIIHRRPPETLHNGARPAPASKPPSKESKP